jgi:dUTP pyrophosphatase
MKIRIVNRSHHPLPEYATNFSAGMDVKASITSPVLLKPMARELIPTGLFLEIPKGYEAQVRPRSGMALRHGITVLNSPGTIDADYRGEIKVLLVNLSDADYIVNDGDRIAQLVIASHVTAEWSSVETLEQSARGDGGFGSTGQN